MEMVAHSVSVPWSVLKTVVSSLLGIGKLEQTDRMAVRLGQLTVFYWVNFSPGESQGESVTQDSTNLILILLRRGWDKQGLNILAQNHMANGGKSLNETYLTENLYVKSSRPNCSRGQLQYYIHILDIYKWISCTYGYILIMYIWHIHIYRTYIHSICDMYKWIALQYTLYIVINHM